MVYASLFLKFGTMYRKLIAYHLLFLFLLCTFQVGITTHYCCGKVAGTKIFFGNGNAGCGMEDFSKKHCDNKRMKKDCCKDKFAKFQFQHDFSQNNLKLNYPSAINYSPTISQTFIFNLQPKKVASFKTEIYPPPELSILNESLIRLQVFRI